MSDLLNEVAAAVEGSKVTDQTKEVSSFEYEIPAAGPAMARFIGYIELGKRPQKPFQGKEKPDCREVRLIFELFGKKYAKEIDVDGETKVVYPTITVRTQIKAGERANFTKLLKAMSYGRSGITHMASMLGEPFLVHVVHNVVGEGAEATTYANLRDDSGWKIQAPVRADPVTGETEALPVPEPTKAIQLLLWDSPSQAQWDSIFIDGERTTKDDKGVEKVVSNNWLQEDIMKSATDFEGSAVQALILQGGGMDLDGGKAKAETQPETAKAEPEAEKPAAKVETPAAEKEPVTEAPADDSDPLAGLDLDL